MKKQIITLTAIIFACCSAVYSRPPLVTSRTRIPNPHPRRGLVHSKHPASWARGTEGTTLPPEKRRPVLREKRGAVQRAERAQLEERLRKAAHTEYYLQSPSKAVLESAPMLRGQPKSIIDILQVPSPRRTDVMTGEMGMLLSTIQEIPMKELAARGFMPSLTQKRGTRPLLSGKGKAYVRNIYEKGETAGLTPDLEQLLADRMLEKMEQYPDRRVTLDYNDLTMARDRAAEMRRLREESVHASPFYASEFSLQQQPGISRGIGIQIAQPTPLGIAEASPIWHTKSPIFHQIGAVEAPMLKVALPTISPSELEARLAHLKKYPAIKTPEQSYLELEQRLQALKTESPIAQLEEARQEVAHRAAQQEAAQRLADVAQMQQGKLGTASFSPEQQRLITELLQSYETPQHSATRFEALEGLAIPAAPMPMPAGPVGAW